MFKRNEALGARLIRKVLPVVFIIFYLSSSSSEGETLSIDDVSERLYSDYTRKAPAEAIGYDLTVEEALKVQDGLLERLKKSLGPVAGYKAALTSKKAQERFRVDEPVLGVLLEGMFIKNGSIIDADFGARPMVEGDLLVRVGDECINDALDSKEALDCIDAVIPFIELPDILFKKGINIGVTDIISINAGARFGVMGEAVPVRDGKGWFERLKNFTVEIYDESGNKVAEGRGGNLLGHPLNVVLWIRDEVRSRGKRLKKGDLLSLGSLTKLLPPRPGETFRAVYRGLAPKGPIEVTVRFRE